jgi:hypothetical protein
LRAVISEIDDLPLLRPLNAGVRIINKAAEILGEPVIAPRLFSAFIHPLLHHRPLATFGNKEAVQIEVKAILDGSAVHLGGEPACPRERATVKTNAQPDIEKLARRLATRRKLGAG